MLRFESASALLSLQKLWSVDTALCVWGLCCLKEEAQSCDFLRMWFIKIFSVERSNYSYDVL